MDLVKSIEPSTDPVSITDFVNHSRLGASDYDSADVLLKIAAARRHVEDFTGRQLFPATYIYRLDDFADPERVVLSSSGWIEDTKILVPRPPLISVSSISYVDSDGATQTVATTVYEVVKPTGEVGSIRLKFDQDWPDPRLQEGAVTITFVAGYGAAMDDEDADNVPETLRLAILMLAAEWNENREQSITGTIIAEIPFGIQRMLQPFRITEEFRER